jgi:hypothetical protein
VAGTLAQLRGSLALPATVDLCALDAVAAAAAGGDGLDDALAVLTAGLQVLGLMRALTPLRTADAPSVPAALAAAVRNATVRLLMLTHKAPTRISVHTSVQRRRRPLVCAVSVLCVCVSSSLGRWPGVFIVTPLDDVW